MKRISVVAIEPLMLGRITGFLGWNGVVNMKADYSKET